MSFAEWYYNWSSSTITPWYITSEHRAGISSSICCVKQTSAKHIFDRVSWVTDALHKNVQYSTVQYSTVQYSTVELRILHSNCDSTQYWACLMWFVCQSNLHNYRILAYLITLLSFLYLVYILSFLILSIFSPHPRFNLLCPLLYTSAESACTVHSLFNCLFCYLWRLLCDAGSEDRTEQDRIGRSTSMLLMSWFWNLYLNYS